MKITNHAKERMKQRCGLPKKAIGRNAQIALDEGVSHNECSGRLKKYVDYLFLSHGIGANIRLYGNHVYIFTEKQLITVLPLPNIYRNALNKIIKRKRGEPTVDLDTHE